MCVCGCAYVSTVTFGNCDSHYNNKKTHTHILKMNTHENEKDKEKPSASTNESLLPIVSNCIEML